MSCLPASQSAGKQPDSTRQTPCDRATNPALDDLRDQLGDDAAVARFLESFLSLLDLRIQEIGQSVQHGRSDECITRLLTLETSSHMVGADELSLRAAALRMALGRRQPDAGLLYADLVRAATVTRDQLAEH
ncbi:MAG: hypothetical protein QM619_03985 [Micropruina sp.]|uniref:hypothetical protein n=1 Tax=Micropruina sp. TaxID=2737536 RepID=UPI0039E37DA1